MFGKNWQRRLQRIIFALLIFNTCLLAAAVAPPFFGWPSPFGSRGAPLLDMALPARQESGQKIFGNMRFEADGGFSLPAAKLLINGEEAGNFGAGSLTVRVYEGDIVTIDGSAYKRTLGFNISAVSSNIDSGGLSESVLTDGAAVVLPAIRFK